MSCLVALHDAFDSDSSVIYAPPQQQRPLVPFLLHKVDVSRVAGKLRDYSGKTPLLDRAIELGLAPGAFFDRDVLPSDFIGGDHHREMFEALDWADGLQFVLRLPSAPDGGLVVKFWRFHPKPPFESKHERLALIVFPHLFEATRGQFRSPPSAQESIAPHEFEGLSTPFIFFGAAAKLVYVNRAAKNLLKAGDVMEMRNGKVKPRDKGALQAFQDAIEDIATGRKRSVEIVLPRADGRASVLAILNAAPTQSGDVFASEAVAIAHFLDVETNVGHTVQARRAQALFGLTDAESEVLRLLLDDFGVEEIAAHRASAVATVRTQIKALLHKTGSHRQRDLLRFRRLAI